MGNCVGSTNSNSKVVSPRPDKLDTQATKNFKIAHSDLVKQKKTNINDDYTFIETLGRGAFGEVKKAIHRTTGITRAVKIIFRKSQDPSQYDLMLNEIQILKNLDHPHIMKIIEFYQDDAKLYLVSEFYDGGELFDKITKSSTFSEAQAANIMKQIFSVVNYCHSKKIVHRDIKPENIVYESKKPDAPIKMIDFGTSLMFRPGETLHKPLGTCYYVAPEVLKKRYTEKCDMWSCGVILYFLLCGHPPFVGNSEKKVLEKVARGLFEFKEQEWKYISIEAMDLIRKLLEYSPEKRLSAAEALDHPWLKQSDPKESENKLIASKSLKNLKSFRAGKKIQESIWIFIVTYFSSKDETAQLLTSFQALDKDKNGVLSRHEVMEGYKNILGKAQNDKDIEDIINKIDHNNSGMVDYSEFVTATISQATMLSKARLESAFKLFDTDGDGFIVAEELKEFLNPEQHKFKRHVNSKGEIVDQQDENKVWEELMKQVDTNNDGKISLIEFKNLMMEMAK